jgi:type II secretory pathway pseudopilin PulG
VFGLTFPISGDARPGAPHERQRGRGFSLLELCLVLAILMIVAAILFINAVSAIRSIRLHQSAVSYANLLQNARIRAVQDDTYYSVRSDATTSPPMAFVDIHQTGLYNATAPPDPMMVFLQDVNPMLFSDGPGLADLEAKFLLDAGAPGVATVDTTHPPTFGPRGLPCRPTAVTGGTCTSLSAPTSFITFLQNTQSTKWEAVTVTPAGRIVTWSYDGAGWSPLN